MAFGFGRGKGGRFRRGKKGWGFRPTGDFMNCICPDCGLIEPRHPSIPCYQKECPRCGSPMVRQFIPKE